MSAYTAKSQVINAADYPGSLIGKKVTVDKSGRANDFRDVFKGMDPDDEFTILNDLLGPKVRSVVFKDSQGQIDQGTAQRFNIVC